MTDAVVADGGAPAPTPGAPIPDTAVGPGNSLSSTGPTVEKTAPVEADKPSVTVQEAIQRANAKVAAKNAEKEAAAKADAKPTEQPAKVEAKTESKAAEVKTEAQPRSEKGQFATKQPAEQPKTAPDSPYREPPSRYSNDAKAAWESTPDPVKAETHRAFREMEQGIQKYKADSEAYHEIREYSDLAKQQGTSLKAALQNYVGIEQHLRRDPIGGLEQIVSNLKLAGPDGRNLTLRDVAAHILGQTPDQQASRQDSTIQSLRNELATLKQQLGGVTQTIQQQQQHQTMAQVQAFAEAHPRFDELSDAIQQEIAHGYSLEEAYSRAERLNPAAPSVSSEKPAVPAKTETPPLNPAGTKSIAGAPSTGSNPVISDNKPVPSIEESLKRAFAKVRAA